jgi:RNA polymerase-binding protein DksA
MGLGQTELSALAKQLDTNYKSLLEEVREALDTPQHQQYAELMDRGPGDSADRALGDALADINLAMIDRHISEIRDIEAARARIADGTFGTCADCGKEVAFERLQAYPTAKRCLVCQQQRERLYAGERPHTL